MAIVYVSRIDGKVSGVFPLIQETAQEAIDENDPEVVEFLRPPTAEEIKAKQKSETVRLFLEDESSVARCVRAVARVMKDWVNELRMVRLVGFVSGVWNPSQIPPGNSIISPELTVTGALVGDGVFVSAPYVTMGLLVIGYVSSPDKVTIRLQNQSNAAIDLPSGTWGIGVHRIASIAYTDQDISAAVTAAVEAE